nr:GAF domain-containing protein [Methylobacterium brachythecii]
MPSTPIPSAVTDKARLKALANYGILDTPAEPGFDGIVQLACQLCDVPVALVSLVAEDRQWFKARIGFPPCETNLNSSVCAHALAQPDELLVIPDLTTDPRTAQNPLVTGEPHIRFYAGAPLRTPSGMVLGTLCVIDKVSRPAGLTETQHQCLKLLAEQVLNQLELRRAVRARDVLRETEAQAFRAREALRDMQAVVATAESDLETILHAVVAGAMQAVPSAEGGAIELLDGKELEYRVVQGTLGEHKGLRLPLDGSAAGYCATSRRSYLMLDATSDPYVQRGLIGTIQLGSAVFAPILRGETVLGVLKLQSVKPFCFDERDLDQIVLFAGAATAGITEAAARSEARAKDVYWRRLFDRLNEGFIVGEVVRNADGRITDWRNIEVNPACGELLGIDPTTAIGRTIREVLPGIEDAWVNEFADVVETGQPKTFTREVATVSRWYEGHAFKLEGDRFGVIFLEVTSRVAAENRRTGMLAIGDKLSNLTTIPEMTAAVAEVVGLTLGTSRAGFGRIEGEVEFVNIEADWAAPGQSSVAGRHRYDDFGNLRAPLRRGEPLVVNDVARDARTRKNASTWQGFGINSFLHMPVRERGRTVAVFIVHDVKPRVWTPEELGFLRSVADRLEAGVARVRSEELQTILNAELAHRLKNTLAIVQSIATQTLRGVTERDLVQVFDQRVLALSRAHDVLLQKSWSAAQMRAVMESVLAVQADLDRFALDGPDMNISPQAALSLTMLLHELATNALKYGALSTRAGKVEISWRTVETGAPAFVLGWAEHGGPSVTEPNGRGGFGSRLIRMGLLGTRNAILRYDPKGLLAEFRAPLSDILVQSH